MTRPRDRLGTSAAARQAATERSAVQDVLERAAAFLGSAEDPKTERVDRLTALLESSFGPRVREEIGTSILDLLRVELLVPDAYARWRPMVQEGLRLVLLRMSSARLAPKLIEQFDLPPDTGSETRLLRFIARMPGFQKLGQVLARNRHLNPSLREELTKLENSISDATAAEICALIEEQLGSRIRDFAVEIEPEILSEATVSAVVRFRWRNPASSRPLPQRANCRLVGDPAGERSPGSPATPRESGVFKVLKPYVSECFAEDMDLLQHLAEHLEARHSEYGIAPNVLSDTFGEVRRLLEHEVDFRQEQATLEKASAMYGPVPGIRTPRLIAPLCAPQVTAMSEEPGVKITDAVVGMSEPQRQHVAAQIIEFLIGVPLFARSATIFHADPHAGNLFYDKRTGELVVLDWALTEQWADEQRRHVLLLSILFALRDAAGMCREIQTLSTAAGTRSGEQERTIRRCVDEFLAQMPWTAMPGLMEVTRLLDGLALQGIGFPPSLLMFRKVLFTLDGILHEIAGPQISIDFALARYLAARAMAHWPALTLPFAPSDWMTVQWSALLYGSRLWFDLGRPGVAKNNHRASPQTISTAPA